MILINVTGVLRRAKTTNKRWYIARKVIRGINCNTRQFANKKGNTQIVFCKECTSVLNKEKHKRIIGRYSMLQIVTFLIVDWKSRWKSIKRACAKKLIKFRSCQSLVWGHFWNYSGERDNEWWIFKKFDFFIFSCIFLILKYKAMFDYLWFKNSALDL